MNSKLLEKFRKLVEDYKDKGKMIYVQRLGNINLVYSYDRSILSQWKEMIKKAIKENGGIDNFLQGKIMLFTKINFEEDKLDFEVEIERPINSCYANWYSFGFISKEVEMIGYYA